MSSGYWSFEGAVCNTDMKAIAKLVLLAMNLHVNGMGNTVWPSHKQLARLTSLSESSVKEGIRVAEAAGWVVRQERRQQNGRNKSNLYRLTVPGMPKIASDDAEMESHDPVDNIGVAGCPLSPVAPLGSPVAPSYRGRQLPTELTNEPNHLNKEKASAKKATPIPANFQVSEGVKTWSASKGFADPSTLLEAFCDHHAAKGSKFVDWDAALRTWVRNDANFRSAKNTTKTVDKSVHSRHQLPPLGSYGDSTDGIPF